MTRPEDRARESIDARLVQAGWIVQDVAQFDPSAARGVAVREYPTDTGPADYVLFVDRAPVGVIEAKRDDAGALLVAAEPQTERYAYSTLKWRKGGKPLRFLFQSTGQVVRYTDALDPVPRSRELFQFVRPGTLSERLAEPASLRGRLACAMPPLPGEGLHACQVCAVTGLEKSLAENRPRALVHMATGSGKTFTAITAAYRLLKFGGARRVLFLVDTRNLGKQAHQEFMAYQPPDDPRKFTELYAVQRLAGPAIDPNARVVISTIQRMYSVLSGVPIDDSTEDLSLHELRQTEGQARHVRYNPAVPVETFDIVIVDECHRSIYNLWKQVLDYFDAFLIGLTATPDRRTYGFFQENVVAEYGYEQSVADCVNVGYEVWEITTEITAKGEVLKARSWVDHRDRLTRARRWAQLDEDEAYTGRDLDRSVVNPSQIRRVIEAMKRAVETEIFPRRREVPKTLIFAKTDSHADDIVQTVREVYAQGNAFCRKVTYGEKDAEGVLQAFRNDFHPRIAVTVDMIATGTDVKPLEVLLFMRDVRSRGYYEQMKGRGVRSLGADALRRVSASAEGAKSRFVLIDAVGVEKSCKTDSRPLERKPGVPLKDLLMAVALGSRDDDTVTTLAHRLLRLGRTLPQELHERLARQTGGVPVQQLGRELLNALDADAVTRDALATSAGRGIHRTEDTLTAEEVAEARDARVAAACATFDSPAVREAIEGARRESEQIIDTTNLDNVTFSGWSEKAAEQAEQDIARFAAYIAEHRAEIEALAFFYAQPWQRRALTLDMVDELHQRLSRPPLMLTTERLWAAYARVQGSRVRGASARRRLTDLVQLVRFAIGAADELQPFQDEVDRRFQAWIFRHNARRATAFTPEQTEWLRMMKDHVAASCSIARDDFDLPGFADHGGLHRAWGLFGADLDGVLREMNEELVA